MKSYYWMYYAATLFAAIAQQNPLLALGVLAFVALRPWLPDPVLISRSLARIGSLKKQVSLNPANIIARRDLGQLYLELRWWRSALRQFDLARERAPRDPEIAYLRGQALLGKGDADGALRAFAEAIGVDPDRGEPFSSASAETNERAFRRFGEAYLGAARALVRLERYDQAEAALDLAITHNSSALEPLVMLARVRERQGNATGGVEARRRARKTFGDLPGYASRRQIGWWIRSFF